jgi:diaminopimelate epimerase
MSPLFWKMHGAGNDFVLIDDRERKAPAADGDWVARVCARRTGVGADGLILIQPSAQADFRVRFFNPDGKEAEMCGNGARCAARLACEIGVAPRSMTMETEAGLVRAEVVGADIRLGMTPPSAWRLRQRLEAEGQTLEYDFVNTGVPHAVVTCAELERCDVRRLGAAIRHHRAFQPNGANADFIRVEGDHALRIRTYERGVEDETLACGTGIVAAALVAARRGEVRPPVVVTAAGGDRLTVDFRLAGEGADRVTLLGPAVHVFRGEIEDGNARPADADRA